MTTGFNDTTAAEYLKYLVDAAGIVIWEYDWRTERYTFVSAGAEGLLGFSRDEWRAPGFWESRLHTDDRDRVLAECRDRTKAGSDYTIEYRLTHADGSTVWVRDVVIPDPILGLKGHDRGLLVDLTTQQAALAELEEIERRYRAIISIAGLGVQQIDFDGTVRYMNEAGASLVGKTPDQIVGRSALELLPRARIAEAERLFAGALQSGQTISDWILPIATDAGEDRVVKVSAAPVKGGDGSLRGILALGEDITQRVELEEALQRKIEDFEAVFRLMRDLYFRMDADGVYLGYTASSDSDLFAPPDLFLGKHYREVLPPHIADVVSEGIDRAHSTGEMVIVEYEAESDGSVRHWEARLLPLPEGHSATVVRDVTHRVQRERALEMSEARMRNVVENSPLGMHFFDLLDDGHLILAAANPAADAILGIDHSALVGQRIEEAFPSLTDSAIPATYRYLAKRGGSWRTDSIAYEDDRVVGAFDIVAFQIAPNRIATMFTDVTERVVAERKEREYQARLRALNAEVTDAETRERRHLAEELHDRVSQSLAVARMHLDAACACGSPDLEQVGRARALLESAIKETRAITTELAPPVLYELGLGSALRWICEKTTEVHGLEIGLRIDFDESVLSDDRKMALFRATRELLMNVVKHADTGIAWVELSNSPHTVYLKVSDEGVGLDPDRADDDAADGFGLFSIKERLFGYGGTFDMDSTPGSGTRVTITVPCERDTEVRES